MRVYVSIGTGIRLSGISESTAIGSQSRLDGCQRFCIMLPAAHGPPMDGFGDIIVGWREDEFLVRCFVKIGLALMPGKS